MKNTLVLMMALSIVPACTPGWKSQDVVLPFEKVIVGVWMPKHEAEELRGTGKLASQCPKVVENGGKRMLNVRQINDGGEILVYDPEHRNADDLKMGKIENRAVKFSGLYEKAMETYTAVSVAMEGPVLVMTYTAVDPAAAPFKAEYLRSSDAETRQNLTAQLDCK